MLPKKDNLTARGNLKLISLIINDLEANPTRNVLKSSKSFDLRLVQFEITVSYNQAKGRKAVSNNLCRQEINYINT